MSDIVTRLREGRSTGTALRWTVTDVHREAADEILRLQKLVEEMGNLLEWAVGVFEDYNDCGPENEGWQSPGMQEWVSRSKALSNKEETK